jgi:predicted RNase H-like HicB family nuclease
MKQNIQMRIERLKEGLYLTTCNEIQGLISQGRTIAESLEIAIDVAKKLLEAQLESSGTSIPKELKAAITAEIRDKYLAVLRLENMAKHWTLSEMEQQLDEGQ